MWAYRNPVHIDFGVDSFDRLDQLINERRYVLVTYDEPIFAELAARLAQIAGAAELVINNISANPDFRDLTNSCAQLTSLGQAPEVIVAVGGGSVLDAAKVLAVGTHGFEAVRNHLQSSGKSATLPQDALPLIAVPTTAGTGSEVTSWATVWDKEEARKYSLARDELYPTHAVIDPVLMLGMPRQLTISTGLDALSHALESVWNVNANPVSENFAVSAAIDVMRYLPALVEDLGNIELRGHMARAATMAGLAFSNTRTALAHSLSYPVTLHHGVAHGIACSFPLPGVMRSVIGSNEVCDGALRRIFGADLSAGADRLSSFIEDLGIATRHDAYGVDETAWEEWVDDALDGERGRNFIGDKEQVHLNFIGTGRKAGSTAAD